MHPVVAEGACTRAEQRMVENLVVPGDVEVRGARLGRAGVRDDGGAGERQDDDGGEDDAPGAAAGRVSIR